jgi:hypothetical protein
MQSVAGGPTEWFPFQLNAIPIRRKRLTRPGVEVLALRQFDRLSTGRENDPRLLGVVRDDFVGVDGHANRRSWHSSVPSGRSSTGIGRPTRSLALEVDRAREQQSRHDKRDAESLSLQGGRKILRRIADIRGTLARTNGTLSRNLSERTRQGTSEQRTPGAPTAGHFGSGNRAARRKRDAGERKERDAFREGAVLER